MISIIGFFFFLFFCICLRSLIQSRGYPPINTPQPNSSFVNLKEGASLFLSFCLSHFLCLFIHIHLQDEWVQLQKADIYGVDSHTCMVFKCWDLPCQKREALEAEQSGLCVSVEEESKEPPPWWQQIKIQSSIPSKTEHSSTTPRKGRV